jgi:recombinational DNA repair ATPase RecF
MFTSLTIQNMRGIKRLSVDGFKRVNLVLGRNNTTKTTLLDESDISYAHWTASWSATGKRQSRRPLAAPILQHESQFAGRNWGPMGK